MHATAIALKGAQEVKRAMSFLGRTGPLGSMPLFNDLSGDEIARIDSRLRRRVFPAGANIITHEEPGEVVYIIEAGTVKIHVEQADGGDLASVSTMHCLIHHICASGEIPRRLNGIYLVC